MAESRETGALEGLRLEKPLCREKAQDAQHSEVAAQDRFVENRRIMQRAKTT